MTFVNGTQIAWGTLGIGVVNGKECLFDNRENSAVAG